ncbi:MAG: SpoIIE family protein phosphatase [Thermoanaerobaculia bacterium]
MAQSTASVDNQDIWADLLGLADRQAGEQALLRGLLGVLCKSADLKGAAIYAEGGEKFRQELAVGAGEFPAEVRDFRDLGLEHREIPGGLLLLNPSGSETSFPEALPLVALAAALQTAKLSKRLKQQKFEVNYRGVELEALYDVGLAVASTLNLEELVEEILLRAVSLLDARRGALYLTKGSSFVLERTFGGDACTEIALEDPLVAALLEAEPPDDQDLLPGAAHLLAVPIETDSERRGLLVVADKESRHGVGPFAATDRRTLAMFANQAAIALENAYLHRQALEKERLEREVELAAEIQRRLLPTDFPRLEGFELVGWSRPARHVGGDYYDFLSLAEDRVTAVLADVSGKGLPAALMVSTIHSALRLLLDHFRVGPELIARLNHHITDSSAPNKFITLLAAEIDPRRGEVSYVNAGHNPALLLRAGGEVEELEAGGFPLGLFAESSYTGGSLTMAPGDLLCIYSDGITECESPDESEFGAERLVDLLESVGNRPLPEVVQAVDDAVTTFAAGQSQGDDQTLVLLRRTKEGVEA